MTAPGRPPQASTAAKRAAAHDRRRPPAAGSSRRLYVYYQVPAEAVDEAVTVVRAMQATLRGQRPEMVTELWRRPPVAGQPVTLMEVYSAPGGIDARQEAAIAASAAALPGAAGRASRHVEVFEACA